jgi:BRO family, N-terminal domain
VPFMPRGRKNKESLKGKNNMDSGDGETRVPHTSPFKAIRKVAEDGSEYWSARDLAKILGYAEWRNFTTAIEKAKEACENSGQAISDHFVEANKLIEAAKGARRKIEDYHLSRYGCYLLIQNADPSKPIVALGQTYFAVQTRRQELADELIALPEDQLRLLRRSQMNIYRKPARKPRLFRAGMNGLTPCILCTVHVFYQHGLSTRTAYRTPDRVPHHLVSQAEAQDTPGRDCTTLRATCPGSCRGAELAGA